MEIGQKIKNCRIQLNISQEILAEKIYVTRQTISNWENDKSYPDINSLLRLSEIFNISLDNLIKGDINIMKQEVSKIEIENFKHKGKILNILSVVLLFTLPILYYFLKLIGLIIWIVIFLYALYIAYKIDLIKNKYNISTFKEILAFENGETLDSIEKAREEGKRPYQKFILVSFITILFGIGSFFISYFAMFLFEKIFG